MENNLKLKELEVKAENYSLFKFVVLFFFIAVIIELLSNGIIGLAGIYDIKLAKEPVLNKNLILDFIKFIFIVPLFETVLHQLLPYVLLKDIPLFKKKRSYLIIISAVFFGITHFYSFIYIIFTFFLGVLFMYAYIVRIKKGDSFKAILFIHMLMNLLPYIEKSFF